MLLFSDKRKSFQLDLEDALSPPPISLSAPELSSRCTFPFKSLRNAVSSTELLHERAMARFYKAVAMEEEQNANKNNYKPEKEPDIPNYNNSIKQYETEPKDQETIVVDRSSSFKAPEIFIKSDSVEGKEYQYSPKQDSEPPENKWQNMSFEEDYTASTVSSDEEYSDEGSFNGDVDRRHYDDEEDTYNPRDKSMRPSPLKESEDEYEREIVKPLPLPDPNFVPKPILKRRELDNFEIKPVIQEEKPEQQLKPKKEGILRKITKMPVQKSFPFPRLLNKKETQKPAEPAPKAEPTPAKKANEVIDKITDEGRTVIDYYSNIVKEYGSQKKPATHLYLNTEELKSVAEKQLKENARETKAKVAVKTKKPAAEKTNTARRQQAKAKTNSVTKTNAAPKATTVKENSLNKTKCVEKNETPTANSKEKSIKVLEKAPEKITQQIVLKKTERATIVIPIDYKELEEKAKENVRSVIDYMVDVCLLLLAFWVYFFKDERLAIPFLVLIIYRQLQETLFMNIPEWIRRHTPDWLKKKTS